MEIAWLKDFVTLSKTGGFSRAANKRNLTQPVFARRIKRLEFGPGAGIIARSVQAIALTAASTKFPSTAQSIRYEWGRSLPKLSQICDWLEPLWIARLRSFSVSYLPGLLKTIFRSENGSCFQVVADNFASCVETTGSGDVDALMFSSYAESPTKDHVLCRPSYKIGTGCLEPVNNGDRHDHIYTDDDTSCPSERTAA